MNTKGLSRRQLLSTGLFTAASIRALATGIPAGFFLNPAKAVADASSCPPAGTAQYMILSIDQNGDPINANVPGSYVPAYNDGGTMRNVVHPNTPEMAATTFQLGSQMVTGAQIWSTLPSWVLPRTAFFHGATQTTIHPNLPLVLSLMGASAGGEMMPSVFSAALAPCLNTVQSAPVSLVGSTAAEYISYQGRNLPNLNAVALKDILSQPASPLTTLQKIRDQAMDQIHARLKQSGTPSQQAFVDNLAQSRTEARNISQTLLNSLSTIASNDALGQAIGAAALIKMNVTPVVVIRIPFGGDNHFDTNLQTESDQTAQTGNSTNTGVPLISALMTQLQTFGLQDQVTFATLNVFGRTLSQLGEVGRNHWANHHVSVVIGKHIKGGVVGGLTGAPSLHDFTALSIDSATGNGVMAGDIPPGDTLGSLAKTIGTAMGVPATTLSTAITKGKVVTGMIVP